MKTFNLLMIDDNDIDIMMLEQSLDQMAQNISFSALKSGGQAYNFIMDGKLINTDLVLLDINLPEYNGLELLALIRTELNNIRIPILMFSTSKLSKDIDTALLKGANAYLIKPSDYEDFDHLAMQIFTFWSSDFNAR